MEELVDRFVKEMCEKYDLPQNDYRDFIEECFYKGFNCAVCTKCIEK